MTMVPLALVAGQSHRRSARPSRVRTDALLEDPSAMNDSTEFFALSHERGVAHLQLNRPERMNTMTPAFFPAVRDAVQQLSDRGETRALVISSTGKHFSAGMALDVFAGDELALAAKTPRERLSFQRSLKKLMDCFTALDEARFPIVCAIQGACVGGALDLVTACDLRVLQRLPKIVPQGVAREMAYTGERVGAERALAIGLVNEVLADADAARERALALARTIASKSPLAIAGTKLALNH